MPPGWTPGRMTGVDVTSPTIFRRAKHMTLWGFARRERFPRERVNSSVTRVQRASRRNAPSASTRDSRRVLIRRSRPSFVNLIPFACVSEHRARIACHDQLSSHRKKETVPCEVWSSFERGIKRAVLLQASYGPVARSAKLIIFVPKNSLSRIRRFTYLAPLRSRVFSRVTRN